MCREILTRGARNKAASIPSGGFAEKTFLPALMKPSLFLGLGAAFLLGASAMLADVAVSTATTATLATATTGNITVTGAGSVTVNNTSQVVSFTASATLDNSGTIENTNAGGRVLRANNAGTTVALINRSGGRIISAAADAFQVAQSNVNVSVNNSGLIQVLNGGQALDFNAITTGVNSVINNAGASILTKGSDGIRTGVNGTVTNAGTIGVTLVDDGTGNADSSDGIDAQSNAGAVIVNTGLIQGRHGITGGSTSAPSSLATWITITNGSATASASENFNAILRGLNGAGVNIDGVYANARTLVTNYGVIEGKWDGVSHNGDGDGVDVDGVAAVTNYGTIRALSATGVGSDGLTNTADGVSIGGGSVDNKAGATISSVGRGILVDNSSQGDAVAAFSLTNAGTITAGNGAAVGVTSPFASTIVNNAGGVISGGNALQATLELGAGADTVTNAGTITVANGATFAIRMGAGDDTLNITGGSITGAIDGGTGVNTLNFTLGAGNTYTATAAVANFALVNVNSGTVVLGNAGAIGTGAITVNGGMLDLNGLVIGNAITLAGGKLSGSAGYTGTVSLSGNAGASGAFAGVFNTGTDAARTIDTTGGVTFNGTLKGRGTFSGGIVTINGIHAVGNSPGLQTFASGVTYGATSTLEWEFAGDTLVARGTDFDAVNVTGGDAVITHGAVLKIINLSGIDYTNGAWDSDRSFVVLDATGAASFSGEFALDLTAAGNTAGQGSWSLDQTGNRVVAQWTAASAVPEPSTYGLAGAGAAMLLARLRRRLRATVA